jgi:hypothetical protein
VTRQYPASNPVYRGPTIILRAHDRTEYGATHIAPDLGWRRRLSGWITLAESSRDPQGIVKSERRSSCWIIPCDRRELAARTHGWFASITRNRKASRPRSLPSLRNDPGPWTRPAHRWERHAFMVLPESGYRLLAPSRTGIAASRKFGQVESFEQPPTSTDQPIGLSLPCRGNWLGWVRSISVCFRSLLAS